MARNDDSRELKERLAAAEERLSESEARRRLLIGSWAQAVWETDGAGRVVTDSPSWRAYTGQTLEEWLGYGWLDAVHPDDRAYAERQWRDAVSAGGLMNAEYRLRAPDGGWRWTNVRAAPVLGPDRTPAKWLGLNIDIDDRKRAEEALRESERRYRDLFESMDEAYAVVEVLKDDEGHWSDFRFLEVNPAFLKHTTMPWPVGKTATELLGAPNPRWTELYGHALDTGQPLRVEEAERTLGLTFDLNIFSLDRTRNYVAVLFTDVTDRKRSEERQDLLLAELQHRVRNVLALVRSIVSRTGVDETSAEAFQAHLTARLDSLTRTQTLLTRAVGAGVDLETLVREEMLAQAAGGEAFRVAGPQVDLSPKAAEVLTLAIHELATNATKYGALSRSYGLVVVSWHVTPREGRDWLELIWAEHGVSALSPAPRRAGFGSELITRRVPYELKGEGTLEFTSGGVRAGISFPLAAGASVLQASIPDADKGHPR